jgi:hemerythrin superfamily protein
MEVLERFKSLLSADAATDIRTALKEDHEGVRKLAAAMAEAEKASERRDLYAQLKPLLTAHARAEEATVYEPMIRTKGEGVELGNEGFVEHSLVDVLLERLGKTELAGSDAWKAHALVLKEMLEHHIDEEEDEFFDLIEKRFDADRRREMAEAFLARKEALLAQDQRRAR